MREASCRIQSMKYLVLLRAEFWVLFEGINHDYWSQSQKKKNKQK